jgi:putative PIN family toxin of toxin-antitoxin system
MTEYRERLLVLDTNVLISHLLRPDSVLSPAVGRALSENILLSSDETLSELAHVLLRPKFDRYLSREKRQQFLDGVARLSRIVPISRQLCVCRDPKDDMFLSLAVSGQAQFLLTGDHDLLVLQAEFQQLHGLSILKPADYLTASLAGISDRT